MSGISRKLLGTTDAGAGFLAVEEVFQSYLYTGNGSTQTITNGIDLAGEGGLVWTKARTFTFSGWHSLFDTERGVQKYIKSDATDAEFSDPNTLTSFNSDGFTLGSDASNGALNFSGDTYASWTFRKAERFFDVVTYTGTGANRTVAHNLGVVPGCIMVKRTDTTGDWQVYHRSNTAAPETDYLVLNSTAQTADDNTRWNDTLPTSTVFSLGTNATVNASGGTYVAYLFAHDPLGPSGDGSDGLIACGSYTGNGGSGVNAVTLGFEPQTVILKAASATSGWGMFDNMRGWSNSDDALLSAQLSSAESAVALGTPTATGFQFDNGSTLWNNNGVTYIYIAIRRGPMRPPESGSEVFDIVNTTSGSTPAFVNTGNVVDMLIQTYNLSTYNYPAVIPRLTGRYMETNSTSAEANVSYHDFDYNNGVEDNYSGNGLYYLFRRAPEFFDVVAYTGTGSTATRNHNLGVTPEFIIIKDRTSAFGWTCWHSGIHSTTGSSTYLELNANGADANFGATWISSITDTSFTVNNGYGRTNTSGDNYIAYLFASKAGVSKVGSYTGNGTSQTINCGFTSGARFVLIKRTDSTGDWYVWDTARGIVAGNDPHLSLNTTAAEVTTDDSVDPDSSGFIVNQVAATNINVSGASYIYLSIS